MTWSRRNVLLGLGAVPLIGLTGAQAQRRAPAEFVMHHAPGCGCCLVWKERMEAAFGREMRVIETPDMAALKRTRGVPGELQSCHTAIVSGYVVEGHVPPADIQRLIRSGRRDVRGLAVPGMPAGSPGMDVGHNRREPYQVIAFGPRGRSVFARHG